MTYSLVIQTSFLGDVVLTTPLIATLARRGPVDVVVTSASGPLLARNPDLRRVVVYDKRGGARGPTGLARMAAELARARRQAAAEGAANATAYLAQGSLRSAALAVFAGFRDRVGFSTSAGRRLYTRRVTYRDDRHHAERLWSLASASETTASPEELRPRLFPGDAERDAVDALLAGRAAAADPLIALAPGSVWATKRWPYFRDLATDLSRDAAIAIVGGRADAELAGAIATAAGGRAIDATGRLSLLGSAELIRRCHALVTNDSAPQHLASAMGTPTITVFGPTVPEFGFGPLAPHSATVGVSTLDCRPCHRHGPRRCPLGHWRCMRDLPVAAVADAVRAAIAARVR